MVVTLHSGRRKAAAAAAAALLILISLFEPCLAWRVAEWLASTPPPECFLGR